MAEPNPDRADAVVLRKPTEVHSDRDAAQTAAVLLELVREMRGQRESFDQGQRLAARERRSERRWRILFQTLVFVLPAVLMLAYYVVFMLGASGVQWGPWREAVGVVRIEGPISSNGKAAADRIVPMLQKAFESSSIKAVVLSIDSPGGAPVEAERIYTAVQTFKREHDKPVVAVIHNLGASAAFMIALHADEIVAARYSLVGSVGAIMMPWRLEDAIGRFDVHQRVYASGRLKSFMNPFTPISPEADAKAQELVDELGGTFVTDVRRLRGSRLAADADIATGEVWSGPRALELGLVDRLGTVDEYARARWGLDLYDYGPSSQGLQLFAAAIQDVLRSALASLLTTPTLH